MRSPEQIAAEILTPTIADDGGVSTINRSLVFRWVERAAREAREDGPAVAVEELIEAWEAFDADVPRSSSHSLDVSVFFEAWGRYLTGRDTPCPNVAHGVHDVTDGSCNNCGSKNRT